MKELIDQRKEQDLQKEKNTTQVYTSPLVELSLKTKKCWVTTTSKVSGKNKCPQ